MVKTSRGALTPIKLIVLGGIILLLVAAVAWWRVVYSSPRNVFNRMLAQSLSTSAVTKNVSQNDPQQQLEQVVTFRTQPSAEVQARNVLQQGPGTVITTESIGTQETDFVQYTNITTDQKSLSGKPFNFSSVIGFWGRSDNASPETGGAQLFNQSLYGVVPFANLPQSARRNLLDQIYTSDVYKVDVNTVKKQLVNGRPVYAYDVTVLPVAYVGMLKTFAQSLGRKDLDHVNPTQYANSAALKFVFEIDVWSGQLRKVTYVGSDRSEVFGSYGTRVRPTIPTESIPINELQNRLQQIQ